MTGTPTPQRNASERLLTLERDVARLTQQLSDRRPALGTSQQPVRLAVTVLAPNPDYDPEDEESSPTLPYPDPPATCFPIQFLDAVNNDPDPAEADQDLDAAQRGLGLTAQAYAMHIRGEYVGLGTVIEVMFQRPIQGPPGDRISERIQWFISNAVDGAVAVKNDYSSAIPPHGLIRLTGPDTTQGGVMLGSRPNDDADAVIVVNDRYSIDPAAIGIAWEDERLHVFQGISSPAEAPAFGDTWGSVPDTFEADKDQASNTKIQVFKPLANGKFWGRRKPPSTIVLKLVNLGWNTGWIPGLNSIDSTTQRSSYNTGYVLDPDSLAATGEEVKVLNLGTLPLQLGNALVAPIAGNEDYWTVVSRMGTHGFSHNVRRFYSDRYNVNDSPDNADLLKHDTHRLLKFSTPDPFHGDYGLAYGVHDWMHVDNDYLGTYNGGADPTYDVFIHQPGTYRITYGATAQHWIPGDATGLDKIPSRNYRRKTILNSGSYLTSSAGDPAHTHHVSYSEVGFDEYIPVTLQMELVANWDHNDAPYSLARDTRSDKFLNLHIPHFLSDNDFQTGIATAERTAILTHSGSNWHNGSHCRLNLGVRPFCPGPKNITNEDDYANYIALHKYWIIVEPIGIGDYQTAYGYTSLVGDPAVYQWWGEGTHPVVTDETGDEV